MINKNIILLPAHISKQVHVQALERCINSVRKYSTYPILLVFSGDITLMKDTIGRVDEYIYTSVNTLLDVNTQLYEFYKTGS